VNGRAAINTTSANLGMLEINSNLINGAGGWNRNIYFTNANHSSISTDKLLFGFHDTNKFFYFADIDGTTLNKYVMSIDASTGNVGIGTLSPAQRLEVAGSARVRVGGTSGYAQLTSGNGTQSGYLEIFQPSGTRVGYIGWSPNDMNYVAEVGRHKFNTHIDNQGVGHVFTTHLNASSGLEDPGSYTVQGFPFFSSDNYMRKASAAHIRTALGITAPNGDNLGNHTATTTLNMGTQLLQFTSGNIRTRTALYGSLRIDGTSNGYAGIHFGSPNRTFMVGTDVQGIYNETTSSWAWYWNNGVLTAGSVPWARLTGVPAFADATHTHAASDITSGVFSTARLGTGAASTATFLRGDGTWANSLNGNLTISGVFNSTGYKETSDVRWKKNISSIANPLEKVMALKGVNYYFKTKAELLAEKQDTSYNFTDKKQIGFIAQEVEKVLPEVVSTDPVGYKTVEYSKVVALLVEAMKEQQEEIEALKKENASLKAQADKVKLLEDKIQKIEALLELERATGTVAKK
jgi:hypothetical protein